MTNPELEELFASVFADVREMTGPDATTQQNDFVFHMMDWLDDLDAIVALVRAEKPTLANARKVIVGFLIHVPPHMRAASRLLLGDLSDPFEDVQPAKQ